MKSVQGDSGHAQVKMVADVYSHIDVYKRQDTGKGEDDNQHQIYRDRLTSFPAEQVYGKADDIFKYLSLIHI